MSYVAIDIGATNIRVAIGDSRGLRKKVKEPTWAGEDPFGLSEQMIRLIESIKAGPIESIGIGSIGPINIREGMITNTPNYPYKNVPVTAPLVERYGVPVRLLNDCAAAVLGEKVFGAGKGLRTLVYVTLSTGLGGGAIVDDTLLLGKNGNAVEVGHFTIDPASSIVCGCGCRGHWEGFCGGKNLPRYAEALLDGLNWSSSLLYKASGGDPMNLTADAIFEAARQGDPYAQMIIDKVGEKNAIGFANIINAYDPELITVGGSIALENPDQVLIRSRRRTIRRPCVRLGALTGFQRKHDVHIIVPHLHQPSLIDVEL